MEENLICGAILSAPDIRDYHLHAKTNKFPESFELPMPEAKQQGMVGSCVAHALATIIEYYNKKEYTFHLPMSVGYIYGNRISGTHRDAGMNIRDALKDLRNEGDVPEYLFPVNVEVPDIYRLVEQCKEELRPKALPHRISSFARVYTIDEMKAALYSGYPIIFAIDWYKKAAVRDGVLGFDSKTSNGCHCMVIYGWNEKGWLFQNSWGPLWGNRGRAILPYSTSIH